MARVGEGSKLMVGDDSFGNTGRRKRKEELIKWLFPDEGWVKLNTGAAKGNPGPAGGGGLIRGYRGEIHEMFALNCGICSCTKAELLAVLQGLLVAWQEGYKQVQVEVDSEIVVRLLKDEVTTTSLYIHTIKRCKELITRVGWKVTVRHCCYREANRAADWLANLGVRMDQKFELLKEIHKELCGVLVEDLAGVAWPRMVPLNISR